MRQWVFLSLILGVSVPASRADVVGLLRYDPAQANQPLRMEIYEGSYVPDDDFVSPLIAYDPKLYALGGKNPVRFAFVADWDGAAGNMDELVIVRERTAKKGRLDLTVRVRTKGLDQDTGETLASSKGTDLGFFSGDGRIAAMGPLDIEGDGVDEVVILRAWSDGRQSLEVRRLPPGKKKKMGPPLVSDAQFGTVGLDETVSVFGTQQDGDAAEEVVTLRRSAAGADQLHLYDLPASVGGDAGAPIKVDPSVVAPDGAVNQSIARFFRPGTGEGVIFLRQAPSGTQRVEMFDLAFSGSLGAPVLSDATLDEEGLGMPLFTVFGMAAASGHGSAR
ncbi:MAG: hypothetical protein HY812_07740 [Planctomycetes bacterium]|nr:hypothetical protein [Planctomycetota bacterium]